MVTNEEGKVVVGINPDIEISNGHLNHCFDYLRQAIMCNGDTAMDKYAFTMDNGKLIHGVNGWGTTHQCRDFNAIYDFAEIHGWPH
ncbi:hypothetical protein MMC24_007064 [Lignoscripta atroalba]|nr:hypothetical protein [Lignoscripta atroalba]